MPKVSHYETLGKPLNLMTLPQSGLPVCSKTKEKGVLPHRGYPHYYAGI